MFPTGTTANEVVSLLQLRILGFGLFQDWNVGIGVLPEGEEVLVSRTSFGGVALQRIGASDGGFDNQMLS